MFLDVVGTGDDVLAARFVRVAPVAAVVARPPT
jgi:hypothetical protein